MKKGLLRFEFYLNQLDALFTKAVEQKNPALWLYNNNARTPLFMLEGLAKMYIEFHDKKFFSKLKEQIKLLEDTIGAIDFYDVFSKEFAKNKKIPASSINYLQAQTREKIQSLNEILKEKEWISESNTRLTKIRAKLEKLDWEKEKKEAKKIEAFYGEAIYEINEFIHSPEFHFDNVEADVHEIRRKIRWLSIYPQALQGAIQLVKSKSTNPVLKKYKTKEITTSAFNKMPDAGNAQHFVLLDQDRFFALSWMIAELGKLKDSGLGVIALKEALQQTSTSKEDAALQKSYQLLGTKQVKLETILKETAKICKTYFSENNLEYLVVGVSEAKL